MLLTKLAAILTAAVALVASATIPSDKTLGRSLTARWSPGRDPSWDYYHRDNADFQQRGLCRMYSGPTTRDGKWPCIGFCGNDFTQMCFLSADLTNNSQLKGQNPDGEEYTIGQCQCIGADIASEVANTIMTFTAEGLDEAFRAMGEMTCIALMNSAKWAVNYGTYLIPGAGQVAATAKAVAKGVKVASKLEGGGRDRWAQAVRDTCGVFGGSHPEIEQAYDLCEKMDEVI